MVMFTHPTSLQYFCDKWGGDYPYCELKKTRSMYYFKYLILYSPNKGNEIPRRRTVYDVVLASSFDKETLQHLLVSKKGTPLTPSMTSVMDWMYCWGRHKSLAWFEDTVELFAFYCHEKIRVGDKELLREVVALKIKQQCHVAFNGTVLLGWSTYNEWSDWFDYQFDYVTEDFFDLARTSINHANDLIQAAIAASIATPVPSVCGGR